jgi:hypothetical protein
MTKKLLLVAFGTITLAGLAIADVPTTWRGSASIEFAGTSTLHSWSGTVTPEPFTATVMMNDDGKPTALSSKVVVKVTNMDTKKDQRDENMRDAMKAKDFPLIVGTFDSPFEKIMPRGDSAPSKLPFKLTLLGKEQQVNGIISNWTLKGDVAGFDLDFDLSLKACGIKVPALLGIVRVGDTIKLHTTVKLTRA